MKALSEKILKLVKKDVRVNYTKEQMSTFKTFKSFFDDVDVTNAYESEWKPSYYRPYYRAIWNEFKGRNVKPSSRKWTSLSRRIIKLNNEFLLIKKDLKEFYFKLDFSNFKELAGERQPKIIRKLICFSGDITPAMLESLVKDITKEGKFRRKS
jgi:hypothetical protein